MAKDSRDTETLDFVGVPRKRGRKATGNAKSAAERQAAYRARQSTKAPQPQPEIEGPHLVESLRRHIDYQNQCLKRAVEMCERLEKQNSLLLKKVNIAKR